MLARKKKKKEEYARQIDLNLFLPGPASRCLRVAKCIANRLLSRPHLRVINHFDRFEIAAHFKLQIKKDRIN
jgi:hypothetical protein